MDESGLLLLADSTAVPYRPIRTADAPALQDFHRSLSAHAIYRRFFGYVRELSDAQARHFSDLDGVDRFALVALDPAAPERIIAVVRFHRDAGANEAEYAATVTDRWQGHGLGTALTWRLIAAARRRGIVRLYAIVMPDNEAMLQLFRDLRLPERARFADGSVRVELDLSPVDEGMSDISQERADGREQEATDG
jgi:RimJ/RimL family protein N-acetyltransferase